MAELNDVFFCQGGHACLCSLHLGRDFSQLSADLAIQGLQLGCAVLQVGLSSADLPVRLLNGRLLRICCLTCILGRLVQQQTAQALVYHSQPQVEL